MSSIYARSRGTVCGENSHVIEEKCWFFFIGDKPEYRGAYPCRFVFVYCNRKYDVLKERERPRGDANYGDLIEISW